MTKRPITIIGGGLSGLALGCYLQKNGVTVTIIEPGKYPRHKVCGEFICGVSSETLEDLGIIHLFDEAESISNIKWHLSNNKVLDKTLPLTGMGISRYLLDDELQKHFRSLGGEIIQKRVDKATYLQNRTEGIVWACGKEKQGKGNDKHRWLGMKLHAKHLDLEGLEMHTGGSKVKGGYIGLSAIENDTVNVCALFEVNKNITGKGHEMMVAYLSSLGLDTLAGRLSSAEIVNGSFSTVAGFSLGNQTILRDPDQTLLPIGDAALLIPPFTGNGMSIALESALLAGQHLLPYCKEQSQDNWDDVLASYLNALDKKFRRRLIAARTLHPFFFHSIGRKMLSALAKSNLIPFRALFRILR